MAKLSTEIVVTKLSTEVVVAKLSTGDVAYQTAAQVVVSKQSNQIAVTETVNNCCARCSSDARNFPVTRETVTDFTISNDPQETSYIVNSAVLVFW